MPEASIYEHLAYKNRVFEALASLRVTEETAMLPGRSADSQPGPPGSKNSRPIRPRIHSNLPSLPVRKYTEKTIERNAESRELLSQIVLGRFNRV